MLPNYCSFCVFSMPQRKPSKSRGRGYDHDITSLRKLTPTNGTTSLNDTQTLADRPPNLPPLRSNATQMTPNEGAGVALVFLFISNALLWMFFCRIKRRRRVVGVGGQQSGAGAEEDADVAADVDDDDDERADAMTARQLAQLPVVVFESRRSATKKETNRPPAEKKSGGGKLISEGSDEEGDKLRTIVRTTTPAAAEQLLALAGDASNDNTSCSHTRTIGPNTLLPGGRELNLTCSVCLCDYESGERLRQLPCLHLFHVACVDEWFQRSTSCPQCRQSACRVRGEGLPPRSTSEDGEMRTRRALRPWQLENPTRTPTRTRTGTRTNGSERTRSTLARARSSTLIAELARTATRSTAMTGQTSRQSSGVHYADAIPSYGGALRVAT